MPLTFNLKKSGPRQHLSSVKDVLTFGKHKDCTVEDILHDEPAYLTWAHDEEIITIDDSLWGYIWEALDSKRRDKIDSEPDYWEDIGNIY